MRVLVDMNLSPQWATFLSAGGHHAEHWSAVGHPAATDGELLGWAAAQHAVILTHDRDFGQLLWQAGATAPSVVEVQMERCLPATHGQLVLDCLAECDRLWPACCLVQAKQQPGGIRITALPLGRVV
ncbi:MAG: DUF5615 family PIN-like protein [Fimbriimonadaceae bacterium]|nr:DUF5615 family PIN-like protein [Fimbriimonadaceae bacterium]